MTSEHNEPMLRAEIVHHRGELERMRACETSIFADNQIALRIARIERLQAELAQLADEHQPTEAP